MSLPTPQGPAKKTPKPYEEEGEEGVGTGRKGWSGRAPAGARALSGRDGGRARRGSGAGPGLRRDGGDWRRGRARGGVGAGGAGPGALRRSGGGGVAASRPCGRSAPRRPRPLAPAAPASPPPPPFRRDCFAVCIALVQAFIESHKTGLTLG